jgi:hypothetical protein
LPHVSVTKSPGGLARQLCCIDALPKPDSGPASRLAMLAVWLTRIGNDDHRMSEYCAFTICGFFARRPDTRPGRILHARTMRASKAEPVMNCFRGRAAPRTGCMLGAATRRSSTTARSRNTAGGRFPGLPVGFKREGRPAVSQAACSARTAARLALAGRTLACKRGLFRRRAAYCPNSLLHPGAASLLARTRPLKQFITGSSEAGIVIGRTR